MAAAMNGIALHGGLQPAGATFLVFTDYARPAMRIAALAGDPGHLRDDARFDRPWRGRPDPPAGRASGGAPRHAQHARLPPGRRDRDGGVLAARAGAHRRADRDRADPPEPRAGAHDADEGQPLRAAAPTRSRRPSGKPLATIFASGSEVEIAIERAEALKEKGIAARVVSVPSLELFLAQPDDYRNAMIGIAPIKSPSRRRSASAGTRSSAPTGSSSACRASAPARPTRTSTRISASPPRRWPTPSPSGTTHETRSEERP